MNIYIHIFIVSIFISYLIDIVICRVPKMLEKEWLAECHEMLEMEQNKTESTPLTTWSIRSFCRSCHARLPLFSSVPYLNLFLFQIKCAQCHKSSGIQYLLIELLILITLFANYFYFGDNISFIFASIFSIILIALIFIDINHQLLPDQLTLLLLWLGLLTSLLHIFVNPSQAIVGAALGYVFFYLLAWIFKLIAKKEGLGFGDFKLLAALGAWLGWQLLPLTVLLAALMACVAGIIIMLSKNEGASKAYAFGPYLAISGWVVMLYGDAINAWYANLVRMVM